MSCHIMAYHVISCQHVTSYTMSQARIHSQGMKLPHFTSRHVASRHVKACHSVSYRTVSYHIAAWCIISYHIISPRVASRRIAYAYASRPFVVS